MDWQVVTNLIGSVGFPILACIFMAKFLTTTIKEFSNNIIANTKTLEKIMLKLEVVEDLNETVEKHNKKI